MALPLRQQDFQIKEIKGPSAFVKAGFGLLTTATVDTLVAFSTPYWATWSKPETREYGGYGLWKTWRCSKYVLSDGLVDKEEQICNERLIDLSFPGWYVTMQVFMSLAVSGLLAALVMLILYIFLPHWHRSKTALSSLIAISYLSGLFIMVALFVFGFKVAEEVQEREIKEWFLSWSFSLACTAFVLNSIAASILVTENKRLFQGLTSTEASKVQEDVCESSDEEENEMINYVGPDGKLMSMSAT